MTVGSASVMAGATAFALAATAQAPHPRHLHSPRRPAHLYGPRPLPTPADTNSAAPSAVAPGGPYGLPACTASCAFTNYGPGDSLAPPSFRDFHCTLARVAAHCPASFFAALIALHYLGEVPSQPSSQTRRAGTSACAPANARRPCSRGPPTAGPQATPQVCNSYLHTLSI